MEMKSAQNMSGGGGGGVRICGLIPVARTCNFKKIPYLERLVRFIKNPCLDGFATRRDLIKVLMHHRHIVCAVLRVTLHSECAVCYSITCLHPHSQSQSPIPAQHI